ncbi:VOC family protein [Candidatus Micrarchaeota archaeon]|nr:VOC family protein [Candidatus Micrarchaeota archaeon]
MQKIIPNLWFDSNAEEAARFYAAIFKDSKIGAISRFGEEGAKVSGQKAGSVMTVAFSLNGQDFLALNGGPIFKFSEAISFVVYCDSQSEIDYYWEKLTEGGQEVQCGWLKDKFGLSWQIVPTELAKMMQSGNPEKSRKAMEALLKMVKLDIGKLKAAYDSG